MPSTWASSARVGSPAPWLNAICVELTLTSRSRLIAVPRALRALTTVELLDAGRQAVGDDLHQVPGDDVVLGRDPGRRRGAGEQAGRVPAVEQPLGGAAGERVVLVGVVGRAVHRGGDAGPGDRAGVEDREARAVGDVVGEVDRAVGALERGELVEELLGLGLLVLADQRDRGDRGVVGPRGVGHPCGRRVVGGDVERADEAQLRAGGGGEEGDQRAGGGDAGGHHLRLRDLELGRADLLGEEARERLPRVLGALAADVLGRPGLVDLAAYAMGELVVTLGGRGRGSGERAGEGDDEESDEDAKAGNDHESEDRRCHRPA